MAITHFTPAPWTAAVFKDEPGAFQIEAKDNKVLCARTPWPRSVQESEANARLIACAPDLYTLLDAFLSDLDEHGEVGETLQERARALLEKAVGP